MEFRFVNRAAAAALALTALVPISLGFDEVRLRRGLVLPVRFEQELSLKANREGDRFRAVVEDDRDLPYRSILEGEILSVRRAEGKQPGYMDLEFTAVILPDGSRHPILAVPIRMDDKSIRKGSDGRFTAKKKLDDTSKHVLGGMAGGYLIGRLLGDKHVEGIFLGALAGIILGEAERSASSNEIVIKRDSKMGALFERDAVLEVDGRNFEGRIPRDDRYNPFDPRNRGGETGQPPLRNRPPGEDRPTIAIEYQGRQLRFERDEEPYRDGDVWMVPLRAMAEQVGLSVDDEDSRRIYVEDDETVLVLERGSKNCRLNGRRLELPREIAVRSDITYVPIDAILAAKTGQIRINGTRL